MRLRMRFKMRLRFSVRLGLGLILLASAIAKLADPTAFVLSLRGNGIPLAGQVAAWALMLEVVAGTLLLLGRHQRPAAALSGFLLLAYWAVTLWGGRAMLDCGCFGTVGLRLTFPQHVALLVLMTAAWVMQVVPFPENRPLIKARLGLTAVSAILAAATVSGGLSLSQGTAAVLKEMAPFEAIHVQTLAGEPITLDASAQPVLFIAWWCPHCKTLLSDMAQFPAGKRPVLVSTFLRSRDIAINRTQTLQALTAAGIRPEDGWTVYLDAEPRALVRAVPTLVYAHQMRLQVETATPDSVTAALLGKPPR